MNRRKLAIYSTFVATLLCLGLVGGLALNVISFQNGTFNINVVKGPTCSDPTMTIQNPNGPGLIEVHALAISYTYTVYTIHGSLNGSHYYTSATHSTCYKMVVNGGFDQLSILDGNNKTGGPVYMVVSTQTGAPGATDTVCGAGVGAYVSNGFSVANALSSYSHSTGVNTYTITFTWTYSGSSTVTFATACLQSHSSATGGTAATTALVDESNLSPTATVNNNGDKLQLTATVTV